MSRTCSASPTRRISTATSPRPTPSHRAGGSLVGDAVWAVLGLAGVGALFAVPALRVPLTVAGCLLPAWSGVSGLRDALAPQGAAATGRTRTRSLLRSLAPGLRDSPAGPSHMTKISALRT
ncbi:LysE family transporter [Streptomyces lomondensis]|uniref:LysE family transporter n=1 Tax=Streptomyces lomondensis TaxID=68229 RepID=UPI00355604F7